ATLSPTAPEAESFPNTATVDFDSLAGPGGRPDTAGDDARVSTVPAIDKTLVDTSIDETFGADLALGEVAGFEITLVLPEVLNEDVVLVDTLPDGLTPLSLTVLSVGSQLSAAGAVADLAMPDVVIDGQTVTVDFGAIANLADDGVDAGDAIVLRLEAVVDADPAANADGTVLTNEAVLSLTAGTADFTVEDTAEVAVIQPELALAKTANPVAEVDAGDVVDFEIVVTNSGTAPAFDIQIEDLLADAGLTLVSGSVAASDGSDASAVTNPDGTTGFRLDAPVLAAGATLTITYQAVVTDAAAFDSQVENTAQVAGFDTNPAEPGDPGFVEEASFAPDPDDPDDPLVDSAVVATVGVDLDKTVAETSAAATGSGAFDPGLEDLSVGETVRYELDVAVPEGSGILRLTDTLPAGLEAVSASVDAFAAGVTATGLAVGDDEGAAGIAIAADGGSVVFDFATVVSTGVDDAPGAGDLRTITVSVTAVVTDSAAATAGAALTNTATLQVFDPADPATELTDPANPLTATQTVEIVEPVLVLDKTAPVAAGPGDTVAYAVEVAHAPTSTADAFDLVIADLIDDPDLAFDSGSVVVTGVTGAVVSETATGFEVAIPALTLGEVATIAYTATLSPTAPEAESFPNTATVDFDSLAGPGGRPDTAGDDARVSTVPAIDKTLVDTSIDETFGADLALGEVAGFEITLVLPEVLTEDVVLVDSLPDGLTPLSVTVLSVGSQLSAAGAVADLAMPDVV
ncbi:MAG: isopeptide-forming domain-containing fimbrial protein, partial [Pseudomonadota bacterium]